MTAKGLNSTVGDRSGLGSLTQPTSRQTPFFVIATTSGERPRWSGENPWGIAAGAATVPATVRGIEEVVPVDAVSTWVLPSGVTVGR